jgi:hypothetical protein
VGYQAMLKDTVDRYIGESISNNNFILHIIAETKVFSIIKG